MKYISKYYNKFMDSIYSEFISLPFLVPIIIWTVIYIIGPVQLSNETIVRFYEKFSTVFFGGAASIFGISLAALSVFISVLYKPAIPKMIEAKLLDIFLFPFLLNIILWGLVSFMSLFTFLLDFHYIIKKILTYNAVYLNLYILIISISFLYTISLAFHVIKTMSLSFPSK